MSEIVPKTIELEVSKNTNVRVVDMTPFFTNIILKIIIEDICISFLDDIGSVEKLGDMDRFTLPGQIRFEKR